MSSSRCNFAELCARLSGFLKTNLIFGNIRKQRFVLSSVWGRPRLKTFSKQCLNHVFAISNISWKLNLFFTIWCFEGFWELGINYIAGSIYRTFIYLELFAVLLSKDKHWFVSLINLFEFATRLGLKDNINLKVNSFWQD